MNNKIRLMIACLALSFSLSGLAWAQDQGTAQEQQACEPDVHRLCEQFIPDRDKIIVCLNQKVRQLSSACRVVILFYVQQRVCTGDVTRLCGDAFLDRDKAFECEKSNIRRLSASCRNAFTVYSRERERL